MTSESSTSVLLCPMEPNDSGTDTVGGYLRKLLRTVWEEDEGFSGKRPFGNSSWKGDVYQALAKQGIIQGTPPDDGDYWWDITTEEESRADRLILTAIEEMG